MCEQCTTECLEIGEVIPGIWIIQATKDGNLMKAGYYGLVYCNDPFVVWSEKPYPDPNAIDELCNLENWVAYDIVASAFRDKLLLPPETGQLLVESCISAGWDKKEHGCLAFWLYDHMGKFLEEYDSKTIPP